MFQHRKYDTCTVTTNVVQKAKVIVIPKLEGIVKISNAHNSRATNHNFKKWIHSREHAHVLFHSFLIYEHVLWPDLNAHVSVCIDGGILPQWFLRDPLYRFCSYFVHDWGITSSEIWYTCRQWNSHYHSSNTHCYWHHTQS